LSLISGVKLLLGSIFILLVVTAQSNLRCSRFTNIILADHIFQRLHRGRPHTHIYSGQIVRGTRGNGVPLPFLSGKRRSPILHDRCGWTK